MVLSATLAACVPGPGPTNPPSPVVGGSVNQVFVVKAPAGAGVTLIDGDGATVASDTTDSLGGFLFRHVDPGEGYRVVTSYAGATVTSKPVTVTTPEDVPPQSLYTSQTLKTVDSGTGYGYLRTRDGTMLSVQVALPGSASGGPYPTLLEYSGYDPSMPTGQSGSSPFKILAQLGGYAYVGINVRGSGCSGGAFDLFETLQALDGYDAIETIAAQPWAGKVATAGISYPAIMQMFVGATQPPHLAAMSPLSTNDDLIRSLLAPGGIKNDGFALRWISQRVNQNKWPNPQGANWVVDRINAGDVQCSVNMQLRQQNRKILELIEAQDYFPPVGDPNYPEGGDRQAPWTFAHKINVPTFIAGAWQDEQTGGSGSNLLSELTSVPPGTLKITATNGTHVEPLDPEILLRLTEFFDFYLKGQIPTVSALARAATPAIYQAVIGIPGIQLPPDRFTGYTDYATARAAYEAEPPVRILWETGAAPGKPTGTPYPVTETSYASWPPPETVASPLYFQPGGKLAATNPTVADSAWNSATSYTSDPAARPRNNFPGGNIWGANPTYDWRPLVDGKAVAYITDPLSAPLSIVGNSSVDLWLRSTAADTDLQVTLTEVRPDGTERYVQNGWLRASLRKVDEPNSTELFPRHTGLEVDAAPLPAGEFSLARVALFAVAHTFRSGSQIRISVEAPGGDRPEWTFITPPGGEVNSIGNSIGRPSRLVLPVVPTVALPEAPAPCPSLRSQPCRTYVALTQPTPPPLAAPTDVHAVAYGRAVLVTWTAPAPSPDRAVTGYTITESPGGTTRNVPAFVSRRIVTGLAAGTHSFTVTADYGDGSSAPAGPSESVTVR
ncbi:MAG: CocE/NonD family hydrolase [Acidimicrobiia bacterium]